jgi:hypothetical protein
MDGNEWMREELWGFEIDQGLKFWKRKNGKILLIMKLEGE